MNKSIKVILPIVILVIIAGIWFIKNNTQSDILDVDSDYEVKDSINLDELKAKKLPIMLNFGSPTCPPCKRMEPDVIALYKELEGKVIIRYIDVSKYPNIANEFPIRVTPTEIFYDSEGKPYKPSNPEALQMQLFASKETNEHVFTLHEGTLTKEQMLQIFKEMGLKE